jgi:hypothetical protein
MTSALLFRLFFLLLRLFRLVFVIGHNNVTNKDNVRHDSSQRSSIRGVSYRSVSLLKYLLQAALKASQKNASGVPLNNVFTVAKYDPMGTTIMASVKARSFIITSLVQVSVEPLYKPFCFDRTRENIKEVRSTYVGTAGEMLDFSLAAGLEPMLSSFSKMDFSVETILRVAMSLILASLICVFKTTSSQLF